MSNHHKLDEVRKLDGHALKQYCMHDDRCTRVRETGDHVIVQGPHGSAVFPDREMGKGLWLKVVKTLVTIGLGIFLLILIIH